MWIVDCADATDQAIPNHGFRYRVPITEYRLPITLILCIHGSNMVHRSAAIIYGIGKVDFFEIG